MFNIAASGGSSSSEDSDHYLSPVENELRALDIEHLRVLRAPLASHPAIQPGEGRYGTISDVEEDRHLEDARDMQGMERFDTKYSRAHARQQRPRTRRDRSCGALDDNNRLQRRSIRKLHNGLSANESTKHLKRQSSMVDDSTVTSNPILISALYRQRFLDAINSLADGQPSANNNNNQVTYADCILFDEERRRRRMINPPKYPTSNSPDEHVSNVEDPINRLDSNDEPDPQRRLRGFQENESVVDNQVKFPNKESLVKTLKTKSSDNSIHNTIHEQNAVVDQCDRDCDPHADVDDEEEHGRDSAIGSEAGSSTDPANNVPPASLVLNFCESHVDPSCNKWSKTVPNHFHTQTDFFTNWATIALSKGITKESVDKMLQDCFVRKSTLSGNDRSISTRKINFATLYQSDSSEPAIITNDRGTHSSDSPILNLINFRNLDYRRRPRECKDKTLIDSPNRSKPSSIKENEPFSFVAAPVSGKRERICKVYTTNEDNWNIDNRRSDKIKRYRNPRVVSTTTFINCSKDILHNSPTSDICYRYGNVFSSPRRSHHHCLNYSICGNNHNVGNNLPDDISGEVAL